MKITIYCNYVLGGWSPKNFNKFLGGSEEMLVMLAEHLASNHEVKVFMNGYIGKHNNVSYFPHIDFNKMQKTDVFISFKAQKVLNHFINSDKVIHWSHEVEYINSGVLDSLDYLIVLSEYHKSRLCEVSKTNSEKVKIIGNFVADEEYINKTEKKKNSGIYCSSPDRGLHTLIQDYKKIKESLHLDYTYITYGWELFDKMNRGNDSAISLKKELMSEIRKLKPEGLVYLGEISKKEIYKLMLEAKYWFLPLNNADSELFCINAIKSQALGVTPVVNRIGALENTVNNYVEYKDVVSSNNFKKLSKQQINENLEFSKQFKLSKILQKWNKLIET